MRAPLIPKLPDLIGLTNLRDSLRTATEAIRRAGEVTAEGDEVLEVSGFGFADDLWDWRVMVSFARVTHVDPKVRNAVVTNRLAAMTRTDWFEEWLEEEITGSSILRPRWEI